MCILYALATICVVVVETAVSPIRQHTPTSKTPKFSFLFVALFFPISVFTPEKNSHADLRCVVLRVALSSKRYKNRNTGAIYNLKKVRVSF